MVLPVWPAPTFKHGTVRNASAPTASLIGMVLLALPVRELRLFGTALNVLLKPAQEPVLSLAATAGLKQEHVILLRVSGVRGVLAQTKVSVLLEQ